MTCFAQRGCYCFFFVLKKIREFSLEGFVHKIGMESPDWHNYVNVRNPPSIFFFFFFFFVLGIHLPMSRKLLGVFAALTFRGSSESYKVV